MTAKKNGNKHHNNQQLDTPLMLNPIHRTNSINTTSAGGAGKRLVLEPIQENSRKTNTGLNVAKVFTS